MSFYMFVCGVDSCLGALQWSLCGVCRSQQEPRSPLVEFMWSVQVLVSPLQTQWTAVSTVIPYTNTQYSYYRTQQQCQSSASAGHLHLGHTHPQIFCTDAPSTISSFIGNQVYFWIFNTAVKHPVVKCKTGHLRCSPCLSLTQKLWSKEQNNCLLKCD